MVVKELIEKLLGCPDEYVVEAYEGEENGINVLDPQGKPIQFINLKEDS